MCPFLRCTLQELDFVAANVMMAIIADFMLVWLPAPTLSFAAGGAARKAGLFDVFGRIFAGCPDNAFQKVQPGMPTFTLMQVGCDVFFSWREGWTEVLPAQALLG
jgi:hypothetical protein